MALFLETRYHPVPYTILEHPMKPRPFSNFQKPTAKIANMGHHTSLTRFLKINTFNNRFIFFTLLGLYKSKYCSSIVPPKKDNLKVTISCCHVKTANLETSQRLFLICLKILGQSLNNP